MPRRSSERRVRKNAAYWAVRLAEPDLLSPAEHAQFTEFLAEHHHTEEFLAARKDLVATTVLPAPYRELLLESVRRHEEERAPSPWRIRWSAPAAAALIGVLVIGGYLSYASYGRQRADDYTTRSGQMREITLKDGSVAQLNTRTELRWIGRDKDRRLELVTGEALFNVAPDATHPFSVLVGGSEIRVIGTKFNVYRRPDGHITVTVFNGAVEVRASAQGGETTDWERTLHANEQLEYRLLSLIEEPQPIQAESAVNWPKHVYKFSDEPVGNVLDELTRYTDLHFVIGDPQAAQVRVGGAVDTRDVRDAIRRLEEQAPIRFREDHGTFTLEYRASTHRPKD